MKTTKYFSRTRILGALALTALTWPGSAATLYVSPQSTNAVSPYDDWSRAATNIQTAVDAAQGGDSILVTNGVFNRGGRIESGVVISRVTVDKALAVRSVNGPEFTTIDGGGSVRCVYLTNGASLSGFTLTNGAAFYSSPAPVIRSAGGGVYCESRTASLSNCVVTGNKVSYVGGGVFSGTLYGCTLRNNSTEAYAGGGAYDAELNNCILTGNWANSGGGAHNCVLTNCCVRDNSARQFAGGVCISTLYACTVISNSVANWGCTGGGVWGGTLYRCSLIGNWLPGDASTQSSGAGATGADLYDCLLINNRGQVGGGAYYSTLNNCTVVSNVALVAGGVHYCWATNCIIYDNSAPSGTNYDEWYSKLDHCCSTPLAAGSGNLTSPPLFTDNVGGNLRLQPNSPCVNAGANAGVSYGYDFEGRPRVVGGTVDIGAYEFQSSSMNEFTAWLQQHGLSTDGSADYTDPDSDRMNNWQEWICGTDPTNSVSALSMLAASHSESGVTVSWQGVNNRTYFLECSTNLLLQPAFTPIQSNVLGQAGTMTVTDTNASGAGPFFYRVGVQ